MRDTLRRMEGLLKRREVYGEMEELGEEVGGPDTGEVGWKEEEAERERVLGEMAVELRVLDGRVERVLREWEGLPEWVKDEVPPE